MRRTLVILAILLATPFAFAQQQQHAHRQAIHPVAAPPDDHAGNEQEEAPRDIKLWDTQILNNKQPPFAALLFNFAILALIYYRYGKKPVANALKERKVTIAGAIENAQKILREAKQRSKRYKGKLEKAADDAEQGKQALVSTGHGEAEMLLKAADEKAARIARDAAFLLQQEGKQTQIDLLRETVEKATKEAEALLRSNVTPQDHERLAEEFLQKLQVDYSSGGLG